MKNENENKKNISDRKKRKIKKKKRLKVLKGFLITLLIIAIAAAGYIYYFLKSLSSGEEKNISLINKNQSSKVEDNKDKELNLNKPVNILVVGVDIGDPTLKGGDVPTRTDTMMLLNYNPRTKEMNVVSIPRDTLVKINGERQKINAAHAIGGIPLSIDCVQKLLGINIDYYGKLDYEGFRQFIDAIGGVDVTVKNRMDYDDPSQNLSIHFKKGSQVHLDGKLAEGFFRWRKNNDGTGLEDGDIGRIDLQHEFINTVISKFKSPAIVLKVPAIANVVSKYAKTNMSPDEIFKYAWLVANTDSSKIKMHTIQGEGKYINDISYFIYDDDASKEILDILHDNAEVSSNGSVDKSKLKVQVLNCANVNGLAGNFSEQLRGKGYGYVEPGNGESRQKTKVIFYGLSDKTAKLLSDEFKISNFEIKKQKEGNFDIIVMLGEDFKNN